MTERFMKTRTHRHNRIIGILFFIIGTFLCVSVNARAEDIDTTKVKEVYMIKGELVNLTVDGLQRISVTQPEVADIINADEQEILLVGQSAGQTTLFLWDNQGKRSLTVYVFNEDLEFVKERIEDLFKSADISEVTLEIDGREGKVVASGYIPKHKRGRFDQIMEKFGESVLNLVKDEEIGDLIQIAAQITELSSTLTKSLGVDWTTGSTQTLSFTYPETLPTKTGSSKDYFKLGDFSRTSALLATVNALIAKGKARVLSQPKLVVKNGQEASFLVGGQIPIVTTISTLSGGATQTQENVTFKSYGISMTITPEINKEKIDITLNVEISDIDSANAVGTTVAFTSRSVQTKLYLDDGQTIVLAGMIKQNRSENISKVPLLGDIPVLGWVFRNKSNPSADIDQELVISLTPTIIGRNRDKMPSVISQKVKAEEMPVTKAENPIAEEVKVDLDTSAATAVEPEAQTEAPLSTVESATPDVDEVPAPSGPGALAPVTSAPAGSALNIDEYVQTVQQKIAQAIVYPQKAERSGWEGTVKLSLLILNDGTLATVMVRESSGHKAFDDYTLNIAKKLAPYPSFSSNADLRELNVIIPVVYSLKKN